MIDEWIKCSNDYEYFIENYVKIDDNEGNLVVFKLYDFQRRILKAVHNNKLTIGKVGRQAGKTTAIAGYIVWCIIFKDMFKVGVAAHIDKQAVEIIDRIQTAYLNLPYWMQEGVEKWDQHSIRLENGSRVESAATTKKTFRGKAMNLIFLDEFAFVEEGIAHNFYTSILPTITKGKTNKMVIISTPNGMGNTYHKLWTDAENKNNDFIPVAVEWNDIPGRDEVWKQKMLREFDEDQFEQEFACSFLGGTNTLIPPSKLKNLTGISPVNVVDGVKLFKRPERGRAYMICVDVSRGKGLDYHACVVFDITQLPYEVVASFKNNELDTMVYPSLIYNLARMYNEAYVLVELNDAGKQVSDILYTDLEYENVLSTVKKGRLGQILSIEGGKDMGVTMSAPVKATGCANLKSLVMQNQLIVNDFDIISEFTTFEVNGKSFSGRKGFNDDLVMCLVSFAWAATQPYFMELTDMDIRQQIFEKRMQQMETDMLPFGFITHDGSVMEDDLPPDW